MQTKAINPSVRAWTGRVDIFIASLVNVEQCNVSMGILPIAVSMPINHIRLAIARAVSIPITCFAASTAKAELININATWSGANEPVPNSTLVVAQLAFDTALSFVDFGGPGAHEWWYNSWSTTGVVVSGSATATSNGTFSRSSFLWLIIDSSASSPELALTSPGLQLSLGANSSDHAPSYSGFPGSLQGRLETGSGGGSFPGTEMVGFVSIAAVPEPATFAVGLLCLGAGIVLRRRRA